MRHVVTVLATDYSAVTHTRSRCNEAAVCDAAAFEPDAIVASARVIRARLRASVSREHPSAQIRAPPNALAAPSFWPKLDCSFAKRRKLDCFRALHGVVLEMDAACWVFGASGGGATCRAEISAAGLVREAPGRSRRAYARIYSTF